jgi:hypothetical protein
MVPDCVDPEVRGFLREIMNNPVSETVVECWHHHIGDLWEGRLHWSGCPACRTEFASVLPVFRQIGVGLENKCRDELSSLKDDFVHQKNSLLAEADDSASAYTEIIVEWALAEEDVFHFLAIGQEVLGLGTSTASRKESEASYWVREPSLSNCQEYQDFISLLEPDVQQFVFAVACSRDLFIPVWERMRSEYEAGALSWIEDRRERMQMAITNSELHRATLFSIIEKASIAFSISLGGWPKGGVATVASQTDSSQRTLTTKETKEIQGLLQEWKRDFDGFEDSMKATQMELLRQIEQNRRTESAYEPDVVARLGESLYSRLHETTRRTLLLTEFLYNIIQAPDGFSLTALRMALGYENELLLRIIWPFVNELLATGAKTYNAHGESRYPLILDGSFPKRSMTLGNLAWYLKNDPFMRSRVSALGFDMAAITSDVEWVLPLRNKAAHEFCDRTVADELRRRILCRDGILSRLHPAVATAADALTA